MANINDRLNAFINALTKLPQADVSDQEKEQIINALDQLESAEDRILKGLADLLSRSGK